MIRPTLPKPPLDGADALMLLGALLAGWTVYLLWPVWTPAYVGLVFVLAGVLKEVGNGRTGPRA